MKEMTVAEAASNLNAVVNEIERTDEEVVLLRDNHHVARIVPEKSGQTALEVMGDLYRTLEADAAEAWENKIQQRRANGRLGELRQTWLS